MKKPSAGSSLRRALSLSALLVGGVALVGSSTGCSTPAYSSKERANLIARNIDMEWKMAQDDIDHVLMLREMSTLTKWNIR